MLAVMIGWVVFRAADLPTAMHFYAGMVGLHGTGISDQLAWQITADKLWMIPIGIVVVYLPLLAPRVAAWAHDASGRTGPSRLAGHTGRGLAIAAPLGGFLLGMVLLYSRSAVPFLYFQF